MTPRVVWLRFATRSVERPNLSRFLRFADGGACGLGGFCCV